MDNSPKRPVCLLLISSLSPVDSFSSVGAFEASPASGVSSPGAFNSMDYLELASLGNSKVFGDLNGADGAGAPMSNGHGGLQ